MAAPPSRLARLARAAPAPTVDGGAAAEERCELCNEPLPGEHRHLLDVSERRLLCACRACSVLMDHRAAGGGHYRLLPDRRRHVVDFELDDAGWGALDIPVEMAFFFHSTAAGRVVAFYPSPMGTTESTLALDDWEAIVAANPIVGEIEADVEALLVNRARGARGHFIVPVDDCYRLAGLIRVGWDGLSGGDEVWGQVAGFFADLQRGAEPVRRGDVQSNVPAAGPAGG